FCASTTPATTNAAINATASHLWKLRMPVLLREGVSSLLERVGELRIGEDLLVAQRLQEGDEGGLLGLREIQLAHPRVEVGVRLDPRAVVIDHLLEAVEPPVVHESGGVLDVAQRRRLEQADLPPLEGDVTDAAVRVLVVLVQPVVRRGEHGEVDVLARRVAD